MIVGVLELTSKYRYGLNSRGAPLYLFRPYDESRPEYVVACSRRDAEGDQIVIVDVPTAESPGPGQPRLRGALARGLGPVGEYQYELWGLLNHYAGPLRSAKLPPTPEPDTRDDGARQELSATAGWISWHIDPEGCRDVDDAFSWHADTNTWAITIADAAAAVPVVSELEDRALSIGATFYDLNGKVMRSMLNPDISEESASLQRDQRRRGLSLIIPPSHSQVDPYFALTWITVDHTFTYESWPASPLALQLQLHEEDAHDFVERQMILYNRKAADLFRRFPAAGGIVRTQAAATFETVQGWAAIDPALTHLANEAATYEFATTEHDQSHAGLNMNAYTHITSPLRRYADLHNQRVLKAILRDGEAARPPSCVDAGLPAHLNERTKAQRRWTRDITFLQHVTPGLIHEIDVIWVSPTQVWVPTWKRLLRLRHDPADIPPPGTRDRIEIFCDPSRRNWRQRVLTAPSK